MTIKGKSAFQTGGGAMGAKVRAFDWASTPLGAIESWSPIMRATVDTALSSGFPIALCFGPDFICIYNDGYAPLLGQKPEALGVPFGETWAEAWEEIRPIAEKALAGDATFIEDFPLEVFRFGRTEQAYFTFSYSPIFDGAGGIIGFVDTVVETTSAVMARDAAALEAERQTALLNQLQSFVGVVEGPELVYTYANDAYRRLAGKRDFIGHTVREVFPEVEGQGFFEILDSAYATGKPFVANGSPVRFEGEAKDRYVDLLFEPIRDKDGQVKGLFIGGYDITEQKQASEALRHREAELRELNEQLEVRVSEALAERKVFSDVIDGSTAAVTALDLDFRILAINKANIEAFERVYGKRPRVGGDFLELFKDMPAHIEQQRGIWQRALAGEEFFIIQAFGDARFEYRYYEVRFSTLRDSDGRMIGASSTSYDVTDKVLAEQQLEAAQDQLRQSQKMEAMGQLTGGVAHDFNNLLGPIVGSLDLLQRRGVGGEREQRLIANALQSADRARILVQRLLAFARRQPLQAEAVDVGLLIEGMADLVASTSGPTIRVEIDVAKDLPPARADANQIEMALLNLSVNARDAMPDGGRLIIAAACETVEGKHSANLSPGRYVRLSVSDSGVGMDEATIQRAIEPFFSTKGIGKGTGLGLSMVHGLAAQLGGGLTISSKPGLGTKVELWLPVSEELVVPADQAEATAGPLSTGTVLVVDDEELVRATTVDMLTELGYRVVEAASAEDAIGLLTEGAVFNLVVTDHLMAGISGTELVRRLRLDRPELPALLVSGYADVEGIAPDFPRLVKPFRHADLAAAIGEILPARSE